jgi:methyl-accepting chemotaxis protein
VAQINKAMGSVDQVTQRNASASEELASTAEEMATQAESLQQLMAFFQMRDGHDGAVARPAAPAPRPQAPVLTPLVRPAAELVSVPALPHPATTKASRLNGSSSNGEYKRF